MIIYQEILIDLGSNPEMDLIPTIKEFCSFSRCWKWAEGEVQSTSNGGNGPSCRVEYSDLGSSAVAVVSIRKHEGSIFRVANVTPKNTAQFSKDEYNQIAKRFGLDLRCHLKLRAISFIVKIPKAEIGLKQIISSKPVRIAFEKYLSWGLSGHTIDDEILHEFTCALFRRPRVSIRLNDLERYLIEDLKWLEFQAQELRQKVETGLIALRVCRR